jgi:hypothetical protein
MLELFNEQEYGFETHEGMQGKVLGLDRAFEVAGEVAFSIPRCLLYYDITRHNLVVYGGWTSL